MKFDKDFHFHIELTDKCQALCPQCGRTGIDGQGNLFEQPYIKRAELTLEQYQKIFDGWNFPIKEILFCGNYGDPLLAKDFLEIVKYSKEVLNVKFINIHTNGSLRTSKWWTELGEILKDYNHAIEFTLDGINQETHSMYRVNTDFDRTIANAKSFIDAGGKATWKFVSFSHSQHQVDEARQMAKDLGFAYFVNEPSKRGFGQHGVMVFKKDNKVIELRPSQKAIKQVENSKKQGGIDCVHKQSHSVYIRCDGEIYPCCYLGGYTVPKHNITDARKSTNALNQSLQECIEKELLINRVDDLIKGPHPTCLAVCGHRTRQIEPRDEL